MRLIFILFVDDGGRLEGRFPKKPTPRRARQRQFFVPSERRRVGKDDVLRLMRHGVFVSTIDG